MSEEFTEDLGLLEYEDSVLQDTRKSMVYPCVVINNLNSVKIAEYLAETCRGNMPLYVQLDEAIVQIGFMSLDVSTMLRFKVLAKDMDVRLCLDMETQIPMNLTDPTTFMKLLGITGD